MHKMRGRYKRKVPGERNDGTADLGAALSPPPEEPAAGDTEPHTPVPGEADQDVDAGRKSARCSMYDGEKVYLGVRVKMPVRDLLRNIRLAQGWDPQDFQEVYGETVTGDKKRVKTRTGRQTAKRKRPTKSLEELAIIIEVLEEDLRTGNNYHSPPQSLSSPDLPVSPEQSPTGAGYNSDESDEMIPSPQSYMTYSPGIPEYHQALSPPGFMHNSIQPSNVGGDGGGGEESPQNYDWDLNRSAYFWTQLQKEESQLRDISDAVLLASDGYGRTALHKVACVGKRALGYAIAKRMAALNSLDLKDSDGMTALLYAAQHNHHLMVADLIHLGANINETNNSAKSCLHLSAEKGYIRVLEVLKHTMMDGVYVDVEATDNSGMSVLQCASVALKATVRELESSKSLDHTRLHTLRQEQMMETLECLLQMGSYLHAMGSRCMQPTMG
ncbi:histone-lysine N-methyltransferase EHMT1 [Chaetodon trifascialis]|uniref:histone-lysine N-methyltransferase EHMT1 n=1 Tax=Chaetodon trifascialis TaxID=109706 RepID=UPI003992F31C